MILIRSILFTAFLFGSVLLAGATVLLTAPFSRTARFRATRACGRANLWALRVLCGLACKVEGTENIVQRDVIIYWKHQSAFETIAQFAFIPSSACVLKKELLWIPVVGWALRPLGHIPIDRSSGHTAVRQVVREGRKRLEAGQPVCIFPEGTRMPPGKTRRYGMSGAVLASDSGKPILPVAHNAGDFWPRRGLRKHQGTIHIVFGPHIATSGRSPVEINTEVQEWIERTMSRISKAYQTPAGRVSPDNKQTD